MGQSRKSFILLFAAAILLSPLAGVVWVATGSAFSGIVAALFAGAAWNAPQWVLAGLVISAPLVRSWNAAVLSPQAIVELKVAAALALGGIWLARGAVSSPSGGRVPKGAALFFAAWAGLTALAVLHSVDIGVSLEYLSYTLAGVVVFWGSLQLDPERQRRLLTGVLALGTAVAGVVLLQYASVVYHLHTPLDRFIVEPRTQAFYESQLLPTVVRRYRPSGTMSHPNNMGLYFALLIPFACALWTVPQRPARRWLLAGAALAMAGGLYATGSRGAAVLAAVALVYLGCRREFRRLAAWGIAGLVSVALFLASDAGQSAKEAFVSKARVEHGLSGRGTIWDNAWQLARQAPFLGVGPGNFSPAYVASFGYFVPLNPQEQDNQIWAIQTLGERVEKNFHAHNLYLQLFNEMGVGGPLLFLLGAFGILRSAAAAGRRTVHPYDRALASAAGAATCGLLVYGLFDSQLGFTVGSLNLLTAALLAFGLTAAYA